MSNSIQYQGYHAAIAYDAEDGLLTGRIAGINDVIGFHGRTSDEIVAAFEEAVDDYLETCARIGKAPERTYSGKVMVRISPEVHAKAVLAAQLAGMSLNQFSEEALREKSDRKLARAAQ